MENSVILRDLVRKTEWCPYVDLRDAVPSVPIHEWHRKFLSFQWNSLLYKFQYLLCGPTSMPHLFTNTLKLVMTALRKRDIRYMAFIDNLLQLSQSKKKLKKVMGETAILFCSSWASS